MASSGTVQHSRTATWDPMSWRCDDHCAHGSSHIQFISIREYGSDTMLQGSQLNDFGFAKLGIWIWLIFQLALLSVIRLHEVGHPKTSWLKPRFLQSISSDTYRNSQRLNWLLRHPLLDGLLIGCSMFRVR
ncbi:hypothetical protein BO71DRAFT_213610 [Aspergillus ellipticus CBS 707.79]|uniref:Uncharacterized protein n=1 Tax=Aspergillus ellipticus CBS 707.79 TaxID=1448320 RepID=A0A319DLV0_9EURO|nr:hypothetical protein BO71DRAFT_213610 [Aspergillus ellipticus CBS 707.79]